MAVESPNKKNQNTIWDSADETTYNCFREAGTQTEPWPPIEAVPEVARRRKAVPTPGRGFFPPSHQ